MKDKKLFQKIKLELRLEELKPLADIIVENTYQDYLEIQSEINKS